jgi:hypothetical protein
MARTYDLERADTARPGARERQSRNVERRRRNTAMGIGSGSDFTDESIIPNTLGAITIPAQHVAAAFRHIRKTAKNQNDRVELLTMILGEGGCPMKDTKVLEITEADDGK